MLRGAEGSRGIEDARDVDNGAVIAGAGNKDAGI